MPVHKKRRMLSAGLSLSLALVLSADVVLAQTPGSLNLQEKRPTTRDPRYNPPLAPPALQKKADRASEAGIMLNPMSDADMGKFLQSRQKDDKKRQEQKEFLLEQELQATPRDTERIHLESSILRQFGTDDFPYSWRAPHEYSESAYRRFEIIFFLALPITMIGSYGLVMAAKQAHHESHIFDGPQTAGMVVLGTGSALGIAWYDHVQWSHNRAVSAALVGDPESGWISSRSEGAGVAALERITLPSERLEPSARSGWAGSEQKWQMGMNFHF